MTHRNSQFASEHAALFLDGTELEVVRLDGREGVSTLFRYDITAASAGGGAAPRDLVGRRATVVLRDSHGGERAVHGIVAAAERRAADRDTSTWHLTVRPAAYRLTLGKDSRVFHDRSAADIVREALAEASVPARFELAQSYPSRPYTAQYREATWDFVSRLCEEEGIFYRFDDAGGESVLVFCDRSGAAPDLPGGARIRFVEKGDMTQPVEAVHRLGGALRVTASNVALRSFDPARPNLQLAASAGAAPGPRIYEAPGGGATDPAVLSARAAVQSKAAEFQRSQVVGAATSARIVPGHVVEIAGHPDPRRDGRLFVTEVTVSVRQRHSGKATSSGAPPFSLSFRAAPDSAPFAPPRTTREPVRPGLQSGVVVGPAGSEIHPDEAGRVRVQLHWDRRGKRDERSGKWMRVSQRGTAGSMSLPRVGWTVITMNEEGSPDAPVVMSRIFDGENPPPYPLPESRTRTVFRTATSPGGGSWNEIRYEDRSGAEEMLLAASRDMDVLVRNAKTESVLSHSSREVAANHDLTVDGLAVESIGQDRKLTIGGTDTQDVDGSRLLSVAKDEDSSVGGTRTVDAKGSSTLTVRGTRNLTVGVAQIDASPGEIKATAPTMKVLVGGLVLKVAYRDMTEDVGQIVKMTTVAKVMDMGKGAEQVAALLPGSANVGGVLQTIGGAKIELSKKARVISSTKGYRESVAGAMSLTAGAVFSDQSKTEWALTAGASFEATGNHVQLVAEDRIDVVCGDTKISVTSDRVTISAEAIDLSGASIDAATPRLELNA